jgi:hypothetical protein
MAPVGGAQREPSMEEILASIRRIIEENDTANRNVPPPETVAPASRLAPHAPAQVLEVDAFRGELRKAGLEAGPMPAVEARPLVDLQPLAEAQPLVEARMPAAPPRGPFVERSASATAQVLDRRAAPRPAPVQQPGAATNPPVVAGAALATPGEADAPKPTIAAAPDAEPAPAAEAVKPSALATPEPAAAKPAGTISPFEQSLASSPVLIEMSEEMEKAALEMIEAPLPRVETPAVAGNLEKALAPKAPAFPEPAKGGILSERTGRQVAAAFGELSDAFAASRRRSFDEIAEEMLRPMLQEWLDNNLPTMVERLVREEIERIARGG